MDTDTVRWNSRPAWALYVAALVVMLGTAAYAWGKLPADARIATHWNIHGEADGFSSKVAGLLILPGIGTVLAPFLILVMRLDPRQQHMAQSGAFLNVVVGSMLALFCALQGAVVLTALGVAVPMGPVVISLVGGMLMAMGAFMGRVKSNFVAGVRTPWTLSSELSWRKSNALAGWLFGGTGGGTIVLAWLASPAVGTVFLLVAMVVSTLVVVVYSYRVWKGDPEAK